MKCSLDTSNFLEEISSLSQFMFFPSISLHCSFKKAFLFPLTILWNSAFSWVDPPFSPLPFASLLSSAIFKGSSDKHFVLLHFFFLGNGFSHGLLYNVPNPCLEFFRYSIRSKTLNLSFPLYNHKGYKWYSYFLRQLDSFLTMLNIVLWSSYHIP